MPDDADFLYLESDFAQEIENYMISKDVGWPTDPPKSVLQTLKIPIMSDVLDSLKDAPPDIANLAVDLFEFSSSALENFGKQILQIRDEVSLKMRCLLTRHLRQFPLRQKVEV